MSLTSMLQKVGMVEVDETEVDMSTMVALTNIVPQVEVPESGALTVEQIYDKIGMSDMSKSIFKVDEFASNFPKTLPEAVRKQSVVGVLNTAGFPVVDLVTDGMNRISAMTGLLEGIAQGIANDIEENLQNIADLEAQIEAFKEENVELGKLQEEQKKIVEAEVVKIQSILDFVK